MSKRESFGAGLLGGKEGEVKVESRHIEDTEREGIEGGASTEAERIRELRSAAQESEEDVARVTGEGDGLESHFLEKAQGIGVPPEAVEEVLRRESRNLRGISVAMDSVKEDHKQMVAKILGVALAAGGVGMPGTVKALEMGVDTGGVAQKATKRIAGGVPVNSVLVEAIGKMTPGTRKDANRIGLQVADASGSSAEQLTKRLKEETAALEEQLTENGDESSSPGGIVDKENADDGKINTSSDVEFVGAKIPKEREKTQQEEHDEVLYGVTVDERFRDQQRSMADLAVDAVKGAAVQAAITFGEKRGSSRRSFEASGGVIDEPVGNTVDIPLYKKDVGENGALELQGTLTQGQKKGPLKSKGGVGGDVIYTWEK